MRQVLSIDQATSATSLEQSGGALGGSHGRGPADSVSAIPDDRDVPVIPAIEAAAITTMVAMAAAGWLVMTVAATAPLLAASSYLGRLSARD